MKKVFALMLAVGIMNACTTEYILMDENANPIEDGYYTENTEGSGYVGNAGVSHDVWAEETVFDNSGARMITANDVFVVGEGENFVTYQYKNVRVDEISPLASLYCADVAQGRSPYLREVNLYHNGFMRATFDCVNLAI